MLTNLYLIDEKYTLTAQIGGRIKKSYTWATNVQQWSTRVASISVMMRKNDGGQTKTAGFRWRLS